MRRTMLLGIILSASGLAALGSGPVRGNALSADLETVLAEWKYPGAWTPSGSGSGGGTPMGRAEKYQALMVTLDPVEKVSNFYEKKLGVETLSVKELTRAPREGRSPLLEEAEGSKASGKQPDEGEARNDDAEARGDGAAVRAEARNGESIATSVQDDSRGRPVTVRIFVHHEGNAKEHSTTTLVISRAEGETETHIAWSHYRRVEFDRD